MTFGALGDPFNFDGLTVEASRLVTNKMRPWDASKTNRLLGRWTAVMVDKKGQVSQNLQASLLVGP